MYKLSNQAVGAIMLALQKGIIEQTDITNVLKEFEILNSVDGLIVNNPPSVFFQENTEENTQGTVSKKRTTKKKTTKKKATKKRTTKKKTTAKKNQEDA